MSKKALKGSTASAPVLAAESEAGSGPVEEEARSKIANRIWIDDAGAEVEPEKATGVQYEFLGRTKGGVVAPADGQAFKVFFRDMSQAQLYMLAGFGGHTLMGNVTNTWLGDKSPDKSPKAAEAIAERFDLLKSGTWVDRTGAGVGAGVNRDALAEAIVIAYMAAGTPVDKAKVRQRIEDDATFRKDIRVVPEVAIEYAKIVGRATKTLDQMVAGLT